MTHSSYASAHDGQRRCQHRHPKLPSLRCTLPTGHKKRHQLLSGKSWPLGKEAKRIYNKAQKETNANFKRKPTPTSNGNSTNERSNLE